MKSKPPAAWLGGEGNMSIILELTGSFVHYVLGKKDVRAPCRLLLLLLLPPLLHVWATTPEPCAVDDDDVRCVCNFTDPEPDWSSAFQCVGAMEVEIRGGGRSLKEFVNFAGINPKQYADVIRALRVRRLTVPVGLPAELSMLDLRCNRLNREPRPDELPKVRDLMLAGNPYLDPKNSGVVTACERLTQALGVSGSIVLLQGVRSLA
ncbi:Monocyte differentiation antigen CD14 [Myotis davidii]|uniref:Monocyte differentiation antigen CD14 n=1 Tax=Myotis davidii TaxID=225400 RepID=L5LCS8_MYODS|nr:Monocyte differentiation antigen CD14 [Myotis davidii]